LRSLLEIWMLFDVHRTPFSPPKVTNRGPAKYIENRRHRTIFQVFFIDRQQIMYCLRCRRAQAAQTDLLSRVLEIMSCGPPEKRKSKRVNCNLRLCRILQTVPSNFEASEEHSGLFQPEDKRHSMIKTGSICLRATDNFLALSHRFFQNDHSMADHRRLMIFSRWET